MVLLTDTVEQTTWQGALGDGYTVHSHIKDSLPDHVLAGVLQGRISTVDDAQAWWRGTLSYYQGHDGGKHARDVLVPDGFAGFAAAGVAWQFSVRGRSLLTTSRSGRATRMRTRWALWSGVFAGGGTGSWARRWIRLFRR